MNKSLLRKAYRQCIKVRSIDFDPFTNIEHYEQEYRAFMSICIEFSQTSNIYWKSIMELIEVVVKQQKEFNTLIKILKLLGVNYE